MSDWINECAVENLGGAHKVITFGLTDSSVAAYAQGVLFEELDGLEADFRS